jgi:hypothetical protein
MGIHPLHETVVENRALPIWCWSSDPRRMVEIESLIDGREHQEKW